MTEPIKVKETRHCRHEDLEPGTENWMHRQANLAFIAFTRPEAKIAAAAFKTLCATHPRATAGGFVLLLAGEAEDLIVESGNLLHQRIPEAGCDLTDTEVEFLAQNPGYIVINEKAGV